MVFTTADKMTSFPHSAATILSSTPLCAGLSARKENYAQHRSGAGRLGWITKKFSPTSVNFGDGERFANLLKELLPGDFGFFSEKTEPLIDCRR